MKQQQIVEAYKAMIKMTDMPFILPTAYALYQMAKELKPHFDFQVQEENKLFRKYGVTLDEKRNLKFKNESDAKAFMEQLDALKDMEIDLSFSPIPIKRTEPISLSLHDLTVLEGFIEFVE